MSVAEKQSPIYRCHPFQEGRNVIPLYAIMILHIARSDYQFPTPVAPFLNATLHNSRAGNLSNSKYQTGLPVASALCVCCAICAGDNPGEVWYIRMSPI